MTRDALRTLFHPFENGSLELPAAARVLFLGAEPGIALAEVVGTAKVTFVQGFRPTFLALERAGARVLAQPAGTGYDAALVLCGRHQGQNEAWVAEAVERSRSGGLIVVAGAKTDGIASLRKRAAEYVPIAGHAAKHHGLVFWFERSADSDRYICDISEVRSPRGTLKTSAAASHPTGYHAFRTAPGMFSFDRIDPGSQLLADCLPANLKGVAADFCAGWGFLSVALANRAPGVRSIDLYEADHASLEAARLNVAALAPEIAVRFFWRDLIGEPVAERYDLLVMNPPFHTGRAAEPGLGEALIRVAGQALRPGGQLFMVANRQLPYEAALSQAFSKIEKLREEQGFKVFQARR